MGNPFDDFKDLYGSTPKAIIDAAHTPGVHAEQLRQLGTDLLQDSHKSDAATIGDLKQISGVGKDAAGHAQKLAASGQLASGCLLKFGNDGTTFDTKVAALNSQVLNAAYADQHDPDVKSGKVKINVGQLRAAKAAELRPTYNGYVTTLDHQADAVAGILKAGPDNLDNIKRLIREGFIPLTAASDWPGLKLTADDRQAYYKAMFSRMTTEEQIAWVNQNKDKLPPDAAGGLSPEVQQHFADEIAAAIKAPGIVDADTLKMMQFFQSQQAYAHELYTKVSPEDIAAEIKDINGEVYPNGYQSDHADDKKEQFYRDFLTAAGISLATYTKGTGQYAPPSNIVDTYYKALTSDKDGQSAALSLLIRAGGQATSYDDHFLSDLTGRVYDFERKSDSPVWGPRDDDLTVNPFLTNNDHYGYASDTLANLLGSMEHSPKAAQEFFNAGYPDGDTSKENDRLHYLLTERTFAATPDHTGPAFSDEGRGLGAALEAAAVGTKSTDPNWSADFTSDVFNTIADKSGTGDDHFLGIDVPDDKWHIWSGMSHNLGDIAASYSNDVYDLIDGAPKGGPGHLDVSLDNFDKLLGEIGRGGDKSGVETLSAAVMIEGNHRIDDAITQWKHDHPGQPVTMDSLASSGLGLALQGRGDTTGTVLGHILNKSVLVDVDDDKIAETRAAYVSKAIDIAGGFIPGADTVLGEGKSELVKSAYDITKDQGLDILKEHVGEAPEATSDEYIKQNRDTTERGLEYNVLNQLIANGYLGDQHPGDHHAGVSHTPAIPDSLLVDGPNGTKVVNPDLYDADGTEKIGKDGQYTPAQIQQMRDDWNTWMNSQAQNIAHGVSSQAQDGFDRAVNNG
ncbi:hypothetical protein [Nocardioides ultimimeridianus]